ncbi:hypothetical protein GCM10009813_14010 [Brevibacterium marinum]
MSSAADFTCCGDSGEAGSDDEDVSVGHYLYLLLERISDCRHGAGVEALCAEWKVPGCHVHPSAAEAALKSMCDSHWEAVWRPCAKGATKRLQVR